MTMAKKNTTAKATQAEMARLKKFDFMASLEWEIACNTNSNRGKVWNQSEIMEYYSRDKEDGENGASKVCHLMAHTGTDFQYIVIKRHANDWVANRMLESYGNQLTAEIDCWQKLAETEDADMLCPIFKFFKSKSDKVADTSRKMANNVVIIAQKAVFVGNAWEACCEAERRNKEAGFAGEDRHDRHNKLEQLSEKMSWWDAMENSGNSGVIFDYATGCYKAVFIDYAL